MIPSGREAFSLRETGASTSLQWLLGIRQLGILDWKFIPGLNYLSKHGNGP
jgi:hypothetical protein